MKDLIKISVPSHPKYLSVIRAVTGRLCQIFKIEDQTLEDIKLAIDEACTNVIKHAYKGDTSQKIVIKFIVKKNIFQVIIEDKGIKAHNDVLKGRDLDDVRPGGLGVHFIKKVFDTVEFDEKKKNGNRLILIRNVRTDR